MEVNVTHIYLHSAANHLIHFLHKQFKRIAHRNVPDFRLHNANNKKAQLPQGLRATAPSFQDGHQPPSWILSNRK